MSASPWPTERPATGLLGRLHAGVLLLDGGLSNQLVAQGCDLSGELWSARMLLDEPEQLRLAHEAYVRAGARVLISSSYQASSAGFVRRGVPEREVGALFTRSVELARQAGMTAPEGEAVWVAASVGPYGAVLADGSEYRGGYGLSVAELVRFHRPRIEALAEAEPDVLALETVPDLVEAEALLRAVEGVGVPVWLSYTPERGRTRAGQSLGEAFALAAGNDQVLAVGVNCCAPEEVEDTIALAVQLTGKPVVVYPNSGERFLGGRWSGPVTFGPALARRWASAGARLIGGCCQVGPAAISALGAGLSR